MFNRARPWAKLRIYAKFHNDRLISARSQEYMYVGQNFTCTNEMFAHLWHAVQSRLTLFKIRFFITPRI